MKANLKQPWVQVFQDVKRYRTGAFACLRAHRNSSDLTSAAEIPDRYTWHLRFWGRVSPADDRRQLSVRSAALGLFKSPQVKKELR
jgi:hypothetical protein